MARDIVIDSEIIRALEGSGRHVLTTEQLREIRAKEWEEGWKAGCNDSGYWPSEVRESCDGKTTPNPHAKVKWGVMTDEPPRRLRLKENHPTMVKYLKLWDLAEELV